ncbi:hypothetical protein [Nonomuraea angiospora]
MRKVTISATVAIAAPSGWSRHLRTIVIIVIVVIAVNIGANMQYWH